MGKCASTVQEHIWVFCFPWDLARGMCRISLSTYTNFTNYCFVLWDFYILMCFECGRRAAMKKKRYCDSLSFFFFLLKLLGLGNVTYG